MEDHSIVDLYWQRDEQAIAATAAKYGSYCRTIAHNILQDDRDAEECVNDTYARAWNSMPSHRPRNLAPYLGKLSRWIALDRLDKSRCQKRGGNLPLESLDELEETLRSGSDVHAEIEHRELCAAIGRFLAGLGADERQVFLARYWFMAPVAEIAERFGFTQSKVKSMLMRTRNKLLRHLKEEELC